LTQIGRTDRENWIFVLNKMDLLEPAVLNELLEKHQIPVAISCLQTESINSLKLELLSKISKTMLEASLVLTHADYSKIHQMKGIASLKQEPVYLPDGIQIELQYREEQKFRLEQILGYPLP
jgi:50S ribosomal subunit-associated GTPase HflX